jgi:hypothetical protein
MPYFTIALLSRCSFRLSKKKPPLIEPCSLDFYTWLSSGGDPLFGNVVEGIAEGKRNVAREPEPILLGLELVLSPLWTF